MLTRRKRQAFWISDTIKIEVLSVAPNGEVRIGIDAPRDIKIVREELYGTPDPKAGDEIEWLD